MYWGVELNHFISFLGTHTLFQCWQVLLLCWGKEQQPEDDDSGGDLETQAHTSCQRCKTHVRWAESRDLNQIFGACNRYRRVLWRTLRRWTEDVQQKCFWLFLSSWAKRDYLYVSYITRLTLYFAFGATLFEFRNRTCRENELRNPERVQSGLQGPRRRPMCKFSQGTIFFW